MLKKLKKIIESTILCIRFPFLYPRNRFTGLHYTNWTLHSFHTKWWKYTEDSIWVKFTSEKTTLSPFYKIDDRCYSMRIRRDGTIIIALKLDSESSEKILFTGKLSDYVSKDHTNYGWQGSQPVIVMEEGYNRTNKAIIFNYVHAPFLRKLINIVDWVHRHPIQWLHCIPTYTELDAMDIGWRKAFGIQMCREIKQALLKYPGALKKYRIMQIKEKFGYLHWYDTYSPEEVYKIIQKYEDISYHTCISCGKPATKISTGWICPYCDDCIGDRNCKELC